MDDAFNHTIETRWADFDSNRHVNNAVYLTYLEALRDRYFKESGIKADQTVLVSCHLTFIAPIALGQTTVDGRLWCSGLGSSSIKTREVLSVSGEAALEATSVSVYVDSAGRPARVPDPIRKRLEASASQPTPATKL